MCDEQWIAYDNQQWPAQWLNREAAPKHVPKPNLHLKGHSHCLVVCCPSGPLSFLNPGETITSEKHAQQIDERHWRRQGPQPALVNGKGPILLHDKVRLMSHSQHFKSWRNGATKFCLKPHIHRPLANWLLLLQASQQLFAGKTVLQSAGGRKCFPGVCQIPKHGLLCYTNKLLTGKNVSIVMVPIWLIKMCLSLVIMI